MRPRETDRRSEILAALGSGEEPRWFRAPGRVNLMGDHTDYNEGWVLPMAIDRECLLAARRRGDAFVRVRSLDVAPSAGEAVVVPADGSAEPSGVDPPWGRYVAGVVRALAERGRPPVGLDAVLASTVPVGAGLSSSAAIEVATALGLCGVAGLTLTPMSVAEACQEGERSASGVPCGIMDQVASLLGREGSALLLDCRSLEVTEVALPRDLSVVAVHSGVARSLDASPYAERRAGCEAIAAELGHAALRDATADEVRDLPLARHVVAENARVLATAEALRVDDRPALRRLFAESHESLRDDFGVSTPELDALVAALVDAGAVGARPTGAGFGGCVVAIVERRRAPRVLEGAVRGYREAVGSDAVPYVCRPAVGAGELDAGSRTR